MQDAQRIADETPAVPGDVVDFGDGYLRVVRHASLALQEKRLPNHCWEPVYNYVVLVEAEEPVTAILAGGGTCLVLPLEVFSWAWPPPEAQVFRNGVLVYDHGNPVSDSQRKP